MWNFAFFAKQINANFFLRNGFLHFTGNPRTIKLDFQQKVICLSICLSVYLSICISVFVFIFLSVYISIYLFVYLSIFLPVNLSICLSVYLSICLSFYLSVCLSVCLSICLIICLSAYISICSSVDKLSISIYLSVSSSYVWLYLCVCKHITSLPCMDYRIYPGTRYNVSLRITTIRRPTSVQARSRSRAEPYNSDSFTTRLHSDVFL